MLLCTEACGVRAYNSKNADADTLPNKPAGTVGTLGLGKSLSVPGASHVEGL